MKKIKQKLIAIAVCVFAFASMFATYALASTEQDYSFIFRIQGSYHNAQNPTGLYRNTNVNTNAWKVRLDYSEEGNKTITTFWLELKDGTNASEAYAIKQGDPARYKPANDKGDYATVYLTGENNSYLASDQYTVSGIWEPDTGIYL